LWWLLHAPGWHAPRDGTDGTPPHTARHKPDYRGGQWAAPGSPPPRSVLVPGQDSQATTTSERHGNGTPRPCPPPTGTSRHGAAGERRARYPVPNACTTRPPCPGRTASRLKHGALPAA